MPHPVVRYDVTIQLDGKQITGSYSIDRRMITVWYGGDFKAAPAGGAPEVIAKLVLRELAIKRDNDLK
jgi:hypothetical protein